MIDKPGIVEFSVEDHANPDLAGLKIEVRVLASRLLPLDGQELYDWCLMIAESFINNELSESEMRGDSVHMRLTASDGRVLADTL